MPPPTVRLRLTAAALLLSSALAACSNSVASGLKDEHSRFLAALARWQQSGSDSYAFTVEPPCFCTNVRPIRATVARGAVISRVFTDDGTAVPASIEPELATVDGLMMTLQQAFNAGADHIEVTYDEHGVPTIANIDYMANAQDDELAWTVSGFTFLASSQ